MKSLWINSENRFRISDNLGNSLLNLWEIYGIRWKIFETPGNLVEVQAKSSALEHNKSHLKQNRAHRAQQIAPHRNRSDESHLNENRIKIHKLLLFYSLTFLESLARAYDLTLGIFSGNKKYWNRTCQWWEMSKKPIIEPDIHNLKVVLHGTNLGFWCPEFGDLKKTDPCMF